MVLPRDERLKAVERIKKKVADIKEKRAGSAPVPPDVLTVEEGEPIE